MTNREMAYHLLVEECDIFQYNLERQFGKNAGDHRYDRTRAGWDDKTKAAGEAFDKARAAYHQTYTI